MISSRIVVKVGTSTLTAGKPHLSQPHILDLVRQINLLVEKGHQVILVTSGAIAAGKEALEFPELPRYIPAKQMLAAVGQLRLMELYAQLFRIYSRTVSQVLLTRSDLADRRGYLNARNTLEALLDHGIIPIVNENDAVATDEIRVGDNDNLSALVANLIEADLLILLTDQEGLFTSDPRDNPAAILIHEVNTPEIPAEIWQAAGGTSTGLGTGGMLTKLRAADLARRSGTRVIIARGDTADILLALTNGAEPAGTVFTPLISTVESRKRYLLAGIKTSRSVVRVDDGAAAALRQGKSLLPVGVVSVKGKFERGDVVHITTQSGREVALGMVNYGAEDLSAISRRQSDEIESILGYTFGEEVVHHNNMVLL
ncbi:MAG TPA: glutamate 5-kinase [Anaerolineaceae bacterium]